LFIGFLSPSWFGGSAVLPKSTWVSDRHLPTLDDATNALWFYYRASHKAH
jgi:hypothetical protein